MKVWVEVKPYKRNFLQPLRTAHGLWHGREGILIQLRGNSGAVSFGEVAPIPWFGTETLHSARQFWQGRTGWLEAEEDLAASDALPATQFGLGTAFAGLQVLSSERAGPPSFPWLDNHQVCGLLPAGDKALAQWPDLLSQGYRTFKWKVGVTGIDDELAWLGTLTQVLPKECRLRLDANGGLTPFEAERWLDGCDRINLSPHRCDIEYLEQPLPPSQLAAMQELSGRFKTQIALDESVATLPQMEMCDRQGWSGLYIIKPAIAGCPAGLRKILARLGPRVRFSSGFETVVGRGPALALALGHYRRTFPQGAYPALGFGTLHYFDDDWDQLTPAELWQRI